MRRGPGAAVQRAACFVSLVVADAPYVRGLLESDLEVLLQLEWRDLDTLWLVQQIVLLNGEPIGVPFVKVLLEEAVGLSKVDELQIHEDVLLLVEHPESFDVAVPLHFMLLASQLRAEKLLANLEPTQVGIAVDFALDALLWVLPLARLRLCYALQREYRL